MGHLYISFLSRSLFIFFGANIHLSHGINEVSEINMLIFKHFFERVTNSIFRGL